MYNMESVSLPHVLAQCLRGKHLHAINQFPRYSGLDFQDPSWNLIPLKIVKAALAIDWGRAKSMFRLGVMSYITTSAGVGLLCTLDFPHSPQDKGMACWVLPASCLPPSSLHTAGPVWFGLDGGHPHLVLICPDFHLSQLETVCCSSAKSKSQFLPLSPGSSMVRKLVALTLTVQIWE